MIIVDTSVWIAFFNNNQTDAVLRFKGIQNSADIIVGDLVLLDVLQGARDERHAARLENELRVFEMARMLDDDIAVGAAKHYRKLRGLGRTIRTAADLIIATFCIREGHHLLHDDRDFVPFEQNLGLRCL